MTVRETEKYQTISELREYLNKKGYDGNINVWIRKNVPLEKEFQKAILAGIRKDYPSACVWKAAASPYSKEGIPDICVIYNGHFFGFEVKRPYGLGVVSGAQKQFLDKIWRAGGTAEVVNWYFQVREIMGKAQKEPSKPFEVLDQIGFPYRLYKKDSDESGD